MTLAKGGRTLKQDAKGTKRVQRRIVSEPTPGTKKPGEKRVERATSAEPKPRARPLRDEL
jgi:hypothetical protein